MKCDELKPIELECNMGKDINGVEHREPWKAYDIDEVDAAIAELKAKLEGAKNETNYWCNNLKVFAQKKDSEIAELKDKCQMHDFFWDGCGFAKRGFKNSIAVSEAFDRLEAENAELKQKLEDAGMRERRLKRALFMAHSIKANFHWWWAYECLRLEKQMDEPRQWMIDRLTATQEACENSRRKCRAKAEEYK